MVVRVKSRGEVIKLMLHFGMWGVSAYPQKLAKISSMGILQQALNLGQQRDRIFLRPIGGEGVPILGRLPDLPDVLWSIEFDPDLIHSAQATGFSDPGYPRRKVSTSGIGTLCRADLHVDFRVFPHINSRKVLASMAIDGKRGGFFEKRFGLASGPRNHERNSLDNACASPLGSGGRYGR